MVLNGEYKMKNLHVIEFFTPPRGGSVIVPYNISKQLAKNGHEVTILTTDFEYDEFFANSLEHATVIPFHCKANLSLFFYSPKMKNWLKNNINNFDIIHLHNFRSYQNMMVGKYALLNKIPYIIQAHGSLPYNGKTILKKSFDRIYGLNLLQSASKCIALNETEKQQYIELGVDENKIEIIPNGINLSEYENLPNRGIFRKKYGIEEDEKIVLYLGRLHKSKGIDLLLKSFSKVKEKLGSVKLILVGPDDGYKKELKFLIKSLNIESQVILTGFISSEEKIQALVDADVFVTPKFTGFPVTFVESCACGTPIITTDEGDKLDWIHERVGYIANYDPNGFGNAIEKIINNNNLRIEFSKQCKKNVKEKFNWEKITKTIEATYEEIISDA
jgi:glycosyltransferase involved in cell wall biosynthesis